MKLKVYLQEDENDFYNTLLSSDAILDRRSKEDYEKMKLMNSVFIEKNALDDVLNKLHKKKISDQIPPTLFFLIFFKNNPIQIQSVNISKNQRSYVKRI